MNGSRHVFHPRRRRLLAWLDADDVHADERVTAHLNTCARCAGVLDEFAAADPTPSPTPATADPTDGTENAETAADAETDSPLAVAIRDVWTVPSELPGRIHRAIDRRARVERELELLLGLVTISKDTVELLLPSDEDEKEEPS